MDTVLNDTSTHEHLVYNQVQAYNGWRRNLVKGGPRQKQSADIFHGRDLARQNDVNVAATQRPPTPGLESASNSGYSLSGPTYTHAAPVTPVYQEFAICKADSTSTTQLPNHLDAEKEDEGYRTGENSHNFDHPSQPNSGVASPSTGVMSIAENSSFHHTPTSGPILTQDIPAQFTHTASAPLYDLSNEQASKTAYAAQSGIPPQNHSLPLYTAPGTISPVNTLPPSPSARSQTPFTAPESQESSQTPSQALKKCCVDKHGWRFEGLSDDSPWVPEVQKKYDQFLHDERINVTEGLWDLFPMQSRLFVGNLPTERITKRDMFHIFYKYGKLAQIAIKQAYGFIQFLEASSCHAALRFEQGVIVRGRKIRLEAPLGLLQCLPGHPRRVVRGHRSSAELSRSLPLGPSSLIECLFHPTYDKPLAFKWTGPDPLSMSTQASDLFLYMSAFAFPSEVHWIEFLLVRFDRKSGESTGEHMFFLPRVETATWNLRRVRGQLLDTISWHGIGAIGTGFRLSLWPRMEPLPHITHLTLPSLC
ncbi:hypothetical protein VN97_g10642 [Penicillium thymicola]|uniref:RRM domain-containing protein n=1 Tax=Penicillium thymicola TaxID=293382 RepID=A0AAI9T9I1_PENTH|nr:hypothetical protein VN97_g10642 [Penicillium thymicola]